MQYTQLPLGEVEEAEDMPSLDHDGDDDNGASEMEQVD